MSQAFGLAGPVLLTAVLATALAGCDSLSGARNDLSRLTTSKTTPAPARPVAAAARPAPSKAATAPVLGSAAGAPQDQAALTALTAPTGPATSLDEAPPSLVGRSELEVQALFGQPSSTEDRPPGKVWHYRAGTCALDVRLFPDVQTRQFGTLSYEVKSDDNSDQGKRACLAQLRTRANAAR